MLGLTRLYAKRSMGYASRDGNIYDKGNRLLQTVRAGRIVKVRRTHQSSLDLAIAKLPVALHQSDKNILSKKGGSLRLLVPTLKQIRRGNYNQLLETSKAVIQRATAVGQVAAAKAMVVGQEVAAKAVVVGQEAAAKAMVVGQEAAVKAMVVGQEVAVAGREAATRAAVAGREAAARVVLQAPELARSVRGLLPESLLASARTGLTTVSDRVIVVFKEVESLPTKVWAHATDAQGKLAHSIRERDFGRMPRDLVLSIREHSLALFPERGVHGMNGTAPPLPLRTRIMLTFSEGKLVTVYRRVEDGLREKRPRRLFAFFTLAPLYRFVARLKATDLGGVLAQEAKGGASKGDCAPASTVPSPEALKKTFDEKWGIVKQKLPGWQADIASKLQRVQDALTKRIK